jgi:hypothetical protein
VCHDVAAPANSLSDALAKSFNLTSCARPIHPGLHNLVPANESVVPGQSGHIADYIGPLTSITERLLALNTKLIFGITSPFLCTVETDDIVLEVSQTRSIAVMKLGDSCAAFLMCHSPQPPLLQLNQQAEALMKAKNIPTVNLHDAVSRGLGRPANGQLQPEKGEKKKRTVTRPSYVLMAFCPLFRLRKSVAMRPCLSALAKQVCFDVLRALLAIWNNHCFSRHSTGHFSYVLSTPSLKGCWCPHCPPGYEWLASSTIAPAIRNLLTSED